MTSPPAFSLRPPGLVLPRIMGHRGAKALAPENTLASLKAAAAAGVTWVEFDVMLTSDGQPVLFHDDTLKRTTGVAGAMAETPLAVVQDLDASHGFGRRYGRRAEAGFRGRADCRVPSLEQTVACLLDLGLTPNVEIKSSPGLAKETAEVTLTRLLGLWPGDRLPPLISSFERESLAAASRVAPQWPRGFLAEKLPADWRDAMAALDCASLHLYWRRTRKADVQAAKAAGYAVAVYTVNGLRAGRRLLDKGVDCLITDRPDRLLAAL
ncbi:glycerophosphoryl diester phosphodiesterase [Pelagibius litoralis]|uniref:Glycerophosphoryl diester phosphodiesterase n=1 Tax=Pelagibius litoralis TaxID=374515 RepID=A0A967F374_9PROT|nr:glycerophosphodiester phosphodiesterase family protein [Pelagibius litoralis]NIA72172.1 glycerophosphoryl diester phosphodiesterase [Pelagibius litoralis]